MKFLQALGISLLWLAAYATFLYVLWCAVAHALNRDDYDEFV